MASPVTILAAAARPRVPARSPRSSTTAVAAVVSAIVVMAVSLVASVSPARADTAVLRLVNQPFAVSGQSRGRFVFEPVPGATDRSTVTVAVHPPVVSRSALRAIASRQVGLRTTVDVATATYGDLSRGGGNRVLMPVTFNTEAGKTAALDLRRTGVYPVTVRVANGRDVLAETITFLARSDPPGSRAVPATPVTIMVAAASPLAHTARGDSAVADESRAAIGSLLTAAATQPNMVSPLLSPEILDGLGTSQDPRDAELLERMRELFAGTKLTVGTFAPVDVSRLVAEGVSPELVAQYRLAEDALGLHLPGVRFARGVHAAREPLTSDGARAIADLGLRTVVFTSASVDEAPDPPPSGVMTEFSLPGNIRMRGLRTLTGLDELLAEPDPAGSPTSVESAARLAGEVLAERADLLAAGRDPSSVHLVVDASAVGGRAAGIVALSAGFLAQVPEVRPAELSAVADVAVADGRSDPLSPAPDYAPRLMDAIMFTLNARRDAVSSMLPPDDARPSRWATTLGIIPVLEPGLGLETWAAELQTELDAITSAVSVSATSDITLGSRTGSIRIRLRNDSDTPLTVRLRLESAKLRFPGGPRTVTLAPQAVTDVDVRITARSNGRFPVTMSVVTPQGGRQIVAPTTLTARVTALAGLGQLVSVTVALVLVAWWFSHWRRGRRGEPAAAH